MIKREFISILILFIFCFLYGCVTWSTDLSESEKTTFLNKNKDSSMSTLYLTCGRMMVDGSYDASFLAKKVTACGYTINGVKYSQIRSDQVGRVDVPGGKIAVDNIDGMDPVKTIQVPPGAAVLLESDWNQITNPYALMGGAVGAIAVAAYDANNPDPSKLHGPLIIYTKDVASRIKDMEMVKVNPVKK
jgi:hypothetical protein